MCGVFGYVAKDKRPLRLKTIQRIATATMARGPHAFGFAWIDSKDRMHCFKQTGRIVDHLGMLAMAQDAKLLIGHCRFATHGHPDNNLHNHPHPVDGGWLVHNGVIGNYEWLLRAHALNPVSACDSEVLGLLIEKFEGPLMNRCVAAVEETSRSPLVMLGLWARPHRLIVIRRGNPLSMGETKGGFYLGSLERGLPGKVTAFKDGQGVELS